MRLFGRVKDEIRWAEPEVTMRQRRASLIPAARTQFLTRARDSFQAAIMATPVVLALAFATVLAGSFILPQQTLSTADWIDFALGIPRGLGWVAAAQLFMFGAVLVADTMRHRYRITERGFWNYGAKEPMPWKELLWFRQQPHATLPELSEITLGTHRGRLVRFMMPGDAATDVRILGALKIRLARRDQSDVVVEPIHASAYWFDKTLFSRRFGLVMIVAVWVSGFAAGYLVTRLFWAFIGTPILGDLYFVAFLALPVIGPGTVMDLVLRRQGHVPREACRLAGMLVNVSTMCVAIVFSMLFLIRELFVRVGT